MLVILAAVPDLLDGALAKASEASSQRGAFFDSTVDRVTDAVLLGGVAWYLAGHESPHMSVLAFAVMAASSLISYQRAKAESLGLDAKGGLMERAERVVLLCIGLLWDRLLVPVLWVMLVLTAITAIQRFVKVWRQAEVAPVIAARIELRRTAARRDASPAPSAGAPASSADVTDATPAPAPTGETRQAPRRRDDASGRYRAGSLLARVMPGLVATGLASPIGIGANFANPQRRAMIERHLRRVNPTWPRWRLRSAVQEAFESYARYWVESFRLPSLSARAVAAGIDLARLRARHGGTPGRATGVILALPHLGGWEWAGRWLADVGNPVTVVVERIDPPELFDWFAELRAKLGMKVVALGPEAGKATLRALKQQRGRVPAVRPRHRRRRRRGRVLRRANHAARPGRRRWPCARAPRSCPSAVYFTDRVNGHLGVVRPPLAVRTARLVA